MPELVRDFLDPAEFFQQVKTICGIDFFCGVPDSLLKGKSPVSTIDVVEVVCFCMHSI